MAPPDDRLLVRWVATAALVLALVLVTALLFLS
jgi:hypothetical protein